MSGTRAAAAPALLVPLRAAPRIQIQYLLPSRQRSGLPGAAEERPRVEKYFLAVPQRQLLPDVDQRRWQQRQTRVSVLGAACYREEVNVR